MTRPDPGHTGPVSPEETPPDVKVPPPLLDTDGTPPGSNLVPVADERFNLQRIIERALSGEKVEVGTLRALLDFQRELLADQAKAEFNAAFARLQPRLPRVKKNGEVWYPSQKNNEKSPLYRAFRYAKYEDIDLAIRPILNEEGFSVSYDIEAHAAGGSVIIGKLKHSSGHMEAASFGPVPLDTSGGKNNLQGAASTLKYGQRHTLVMLLNLVFEGEDDDGTGGPIDDGQVKHLRELLGKTDRSEPAFLKFMKVERFEDIAYKDYPKAVAALEERIGGRGG